MGTITLSNFDLYDKLYEYAYTAGSCPSAFDCYLILRGLKTLEVRVKEASRNAYLLALFLEKHPYCEKVLYPGLKSHPQHELFRS